MAPELRNSGSHAPLPSEQERARNAPNPAINRAENQARNQSETPPHDGVKAHATNYHFPKNKLSLTKNKV